MAFASGCLATHLQNLGMVGRKRDCWNGYYLFQPNCWWVHQPCCWTEIDICHFSNPSCSSALLLTTSPMVIQQFCGGLWDENGCKHFMNYKLAWIVMNLGLWQGSWLSLLLILVPNGGGGYCFMIISIAQEQEEVKLQQSLKAGFKL